MPGCRDVVATHASLHGAAAVAARDASAAAACDADSSFLSKSPLAAAAPPARVPPAPPIDDSGDVGLSGVTTGSGVPDMLAETVERDNVDPVHDCRSCPNTPPRPPQPKFRASHAYNLCSKHYQ